MIKKILKIAFLFIIFFSFDTVKAITTDFEIITYDFKVDVKDNRIANINEKYNIYFMKKMPTIERNLSNKLKIIRPNNTNILNYINLSDIKVLTNNFDYEKNKITIYNETEKETVSLFEIEYKYNLGKDLSNSYDELYFNIVDGTIDNNISNVNFEIKMPKNFDENKIRFLIDNSYDISDDDINYSVEDNVIKGSLTKFLNPNQTFSVRIELRNNYFTNETDNYNYLMLIILLIPVGLLILGLVSWFKYARNNRLKGTITTNPPSNYDSAEIGFLYNGYSKEHDLVSVLLKLANTGCIMFIEEDDGYKLERPNSFKIVKLNKYKGNNAVTKMLFEKLFSKKDIIDIKDIEYNLYDTLFKSKDTLDNLENRNKMFFKNVKLIKKIMFSLIVVGSIITNIYPSKIIFGTYFLAPLLASFLVLGIYIAFIMPSKIISKILIGGTLILATTFLSCFMLLNDLKTLFIFLIATTLIVIASYIYKTLPIRTKYGNKLLGEVYGFKIGLENMTKETLKNNLLDNPNYFYEMYPYTYVFNITDAWITKGIDIIKEYPSWYQTKEDFSLQNFQKFCRNMIYITTQAMYKRQTSGSSMHIEYKKASKIQALEEN